MRKNEKNQKRACVFWEKVLYYLLARTELQEVSFLPNIKSASKREQLSKLQNAANKAKRSELKTEIKKFEAKVEEGSKSAAQEAYVVAIKSVDQAVSDHILHKNNAARKKSRLTRKLNAMQ